MPDSTDEHGLPLWPAPERNKQPILDQLHRLLPASGGLFLEVASGSGQHVLHFARAIPHWSFQPSECDLEHLDTLRARQALSRLDNLRAPVRLDAAQHPWPLAKVDVIYNANMVHIAPWRVAEGLMSGAGRALTEAGMLITYGPYCFDGVQTSESNRQFDESLRARDPSWGVRDVKDLQTLAKRTGLTLRDTIAMPANNFLLVWIRA